MSKLLFKDSDSLVIIIDFSNYSSKSKYHDDSSKLVTEK